MKECSIVPVRGVLRANTRFLINQSPFQLGCALGYAANANGFSIFGNQGVLRSVGIHEPLSHLLKKCRGLGMKHNRLSLLMLIAVLCLAARARADDTRTQASVPLQANSGASHDQDSIRQILELERQAKDASVHRDAAFAERMLTDDYVAITPLGHVITKADTIAARRSGQLRYDSIDISDMVVRVYGNTAVVTARAEVRGKHLGEEFNGPYRYTRVWIRRSGHWQTVSYQATITR